MCTNATHDESDLRGLIGDTATKACAAVRDAGVVRPHPLTESAEGELSVEKDCTSKEGGYLAVVWIAFKRGCVRACASRQRSERKWRGKRNPQDGRYHCARATREVSHGGSSSGGAPVDWRETMKMPTIRIVKRIAT